jgi:hypothetical protein
MDARGQRWRFCGSTSGRQENGSTCHFRASIWSCDRYATAQPHITALTSLHERFSSFRKRIIITANTTTAKVIMDEINQTLFQSNWNPDSEVYRICKVHELSLFEILIT